MDMNKAPAIESKATTVTPEVTLKCLEQRVIGIACISTHELVAVSAWDGVYIYEYKTQVEPIRVFERHKGDVHGLVHLCDDVLGSVDEDGMLLTWRATTGAILGKLQVSKSGCSRIAKADDREVLVGTKNGDVIIVGHENGKNLAVKKLCIGDTNGWIKDISAYDDIFVAVEMSTVHVWNSSKRQPLNSINIAGDRLYSVAISDDFIVVGGKRCKIYVHEIQDGYNLVTTIDLRKFHDFLGAYDNIYMGIMDISFLNADIVIATTRNEGSFFVSLQSGECISYCQLENSEYLLEATVLDDGRVCVGGGEGYCVIFKPPQKAEDLIAGYVRRKYSHPLLELIPFFSPPLEGAFAGVQRKSLSFANALELAASSKINSTSIQEWSYAHLIVMAAVKADDVQCSRKYKGDDIFWWNHLYKKASLIEMGMEDKRLVIKFIIEAEQAGILGGGCAEMFQETNEIRCEMNMLSSTIVDLYTRQIAMHEQVRGILHYQRVQTAMSFVNAILACIPVAGGAAAHVISGGMAILENADGEDFAVSGLVESLFGVGKDWSSFITEPIVKRFLKAGDVVLEEETWKEIPEANRRAVEAAADMLGLSIDELRRRLRVAAQGEPAVGEDGDEEGMSRVTGGDGDIVVVNATGESLQNLPMDPSDGRERREGGPSRTAEERNEGQDRELWKVVEMLLLRNQELEEKIAAMERLREAQFKISKELKVNIEVLKQQNHAQGERIEEIEGNLLRK